MSVEAALPWGLQEGRRCQHAPGRGREGISASLGELQLHVAKPLPGEGGFTQHSPRLPGRHLRGYFYNAVCLLQTSGLLSARRSSDQPAAGPCSVEAPNPQHNKRQRETSLLQSRADSRGIHSADG